jgi:hypothetical protein
MLLAVLSAVLADTIGDQPAARANLTIGSRLLPLMGEAASGTVVHQAHPE